MEHSTYENKWVFVVVQNPGKDETIVGQKDTENDIRFIPVFPDRETGLQGIVHLAKEPGQAFEIHAIMYDDLLKYAQKDGYLLFFIDGSGRISTKMGPDGRPL